MTLTKTFSSVSYILNAVLATVIICAVMHMFDHHILLPLWRAKRQYLVPLGDKGREGETIAVKIDKKL